jgi:hypothetical protein
MKNYIKKLLTIFFSSSLAFVFLLLGIVYLGDPLQLFHSKSSSNLIVPNARHQVAAMINNRSFDSIILGASYLENTSGYEASKILGGSFINISINGSDFHERLVILKHALEKKSLKKVIYSLDHAGLIDSRITDTSSFDFLYDKYKYNDLKIYITPKYLICSIYNSYCLKPAEEDRPFAWYKDKEFNKRLGGFENWLHPENSFQVNNALKRIASTIEKIKLGITDKTIKNTLPESQKYLDTMLIDYVAIYPDTEFILVLPPLSRVRNALDAQYYVGVFERYTQNIQYLVSKTSSYSNLKIYGWGNHSFVDDISNYSDLGHHHFQINSWMLDAISQNEGLLTIANINPYLNLLKNKSLEFNLNEIGDEIDDYFKQ